MPHRIAVAVYDRLAAFEFGIACEIFGLDRRELIADWYEYLPCRIEAGRLFSTHGLELRPEGCMADFANADTIIVPGWREPHEAPAQDFLDALRAAVERKARIVSICTGVFALAHSGVLDGRRVTTHWLHAETLRDSFPKLQVEASALYVHDRKHGAQISTSAGSAAGLDLCLAIVREDFGIAAANSIARRMVAPVHREGGQTQYAELTIAKTEIESFGEVLEWMEAHLQEALVATTIASKFGYSLRSFQRRFKELTSLSPQQWLIQQRVLRARELLESTDDSVERIAALAGLGSAANMRKHFARHSGTTPRAYRVAFRAGD